MFGVDFLYFRLCFIVYFLILFLFFFVPPSSINFTPLIFSVFLRVGFFGEGVFFNVLGGDFGDGDFGVGDFGVGDGDFGVNDFC